MDYNPVRSRNLYVPYEDNPFSLSRSKVELFIECPRCFYIDRRAGTARPPVHPYNLNLAVDYLLKKEFDVYRHKGIPHPLMKKYDDKVLCYNHPELSKWRENFVGIKHHHHDTNFVLTGAVDDLWIKDDKLIIVDYKATASDYKLTFKGPRYDKYKRQLDFYCYLFQVNGFDVSAKALFFACNAVRAKKDFDGKLDFDISIIEHKVDTSWIEDTIFAIYETLQDNTPPEASATCNYCAYSSAKGKV